MTYHARATDPDTSHAAANTINPSHKVMMLLAYADADADGLTSDEAGVACGLAARPRCCYWHRTSDLISLGWVEDTGARRPGLAGRKQMVCRITEWGRDEARRWR